MVELIFPALCYTVAAWSAFMLGSLWRDRKTARAIAKLGELHKSNVAAAYERGYREGITSQMEVETRNARR